MTTPSIESLNTRLKRTHIKLLRHKETCLYGGVILMGESSVVDESSCPTAYTDGYNKRYGSKFISKLSDVELAGLVLHENFHILMKHLIRGRDLMKEDARLANMAMDYAVNQVIVDLASKDSTLCKLPEGGLYDPMFRDWSFRKIYDYLKQEQDEGGGGGRGGEPLDEHGDQLVDGLTQEQRDQLSRDITEALQQSAILAGKLGANIPRTISDLMEPKVNWREALREFLASTTRGKDEYTWHRMNKRRLADEHYVPGVYSETMGEVVIAIDTSGSIGQEQLSEFASELASICETATPEAIRILWWDTMVHGEQRFDPNNYNQIATLLKPQGGGGTRVGCVNEYMTQNNINAECLIVFTDGYVEDEFEWAVTVPTLWMVTRKRSFAAPSGVVINVEK